MVPIKKLTPMAKRKLDREGLIRIEGWATDGLTDEQIAKNMGIAYSTLRVWVKNYSALSAVLKRAKDIVDREVEGALIKKAKGFYYTETKRTVETNGEGYETVKVETFERMAQPDTTAQIFWLKNRKPAVWRNKVEYTDNSQFDKLDKILGDIKNVANN